MSKRLFAAVILSLLGCDTAGRIEKSDTHSHSTVKSAEKQYAELIAAFSDVEPKISDAQPGQLPSGLLSGDGNRQIQKEDTLRKGDKKSQNLPEATQNQTCIRESLSGPDHCVTLLKKPYVPYDRH